MKSGNQKILIITYYWPPAGGPGVQRWLKFAKYLPEFGLDPIILTVDPKTATYPIVDDSLTLETSDMEVHYAETKELFSLYKKASGRSEVPYSGFANESDKPGPRQRLAKFIRGNFFIPDPRRAWNKRAVKKALELIDKQNIKHVITTSPPHSSQLIGLELKKRRDISWMADLRDPWTDIYYYNQFYPTQLARKYDLRLERTIFEKADYISTVSKDLVRLFKEKSAKIHESKFVILPNGYDADDFSENLDAVTSQKWTMSYTGTVTKDYSLEGLFTALRELPEDVANRVKVQFVGRRDEVLEKTLESMKTDFPVEVVTKGHVDHKKAVAIMRTSNALLLGIPNIANNKGILTGKIFEYLGSQTPVLGLGPVDGDAAAILHETKAGEMFDYSNVQGIKNWIIDSVNGGNQYLSSSHHDYERKSLTQKLAEALLK